MTDVNEAIRRADELLPGVPAREGEVDARWQAIIDVVEELALRDKRFGDTLRRCWKPGQANQPKNSARWDRLMRRLP